MFRYKNLSLALVSFAAFILWGCSSSPNNALTNGQLLGCTASGTLATGSTTLASGVSVIVTNGVGPFSITIGSQSPVVTSSATYNAPGSIPIQGTTANVQVVDQGNANASAVCTLTVGNPNVTTNGATITISTSTGSTSGLPLNTPITLTASTGSTYTYSWSFNYTSGGSSGVNLSSSNTSQVTIQSSMATTVTVNVTAYSGSSIVGTGSLALGFQTNAITTGGITITTSTGTTSNLPFNTPIILTASTVSGATSYAFSQTYTSGQTITSGIVLTGNGTGNTATINDTGSVVATVTVNVTAYSSSGASLATGSVVLGFGTGVTTGGALVLSASPSSSVAINTPIYLTIQNSAGVSGVTFTASPQIGGVSVQSTAGSNTATVYSSVATTVTVVASGYLNGAAVSGTITLTFYNGNGTTGGNLQCLLGHNVASAYFPGTYTYFDIKTNTGEPVVVTYFNDGEPWEVPPPYPIRPILTVIYGYPGIKYVTIQAQSALSGAPCNGGAPLRDELVVSRYY